jgi:hypothetical protein
MQYHSRPLAILVARLAVYLTLLCRGLLRKAGAAWRALCAQCHCPVNGCACDCSLSVSEIKEGVHICVWWQAWQLSLCPGLVSWECYEHAMEDMCGVADEHLFGVLSCKHWGASSRPACPVAHVRLFKQAQQWLFGWTRARHLGRAALACSQLGCACRHARHGNRIVAAMVALAVVFYLLNQGCPVPRLTIQSCFQLACYRLLSAATATAFLEAVRCEGCSRCSFCLVVNCPK